MEGRADERLEADEEAGHAALAKHAPQRREQRATLPTRAAALIELREEHVARLAEHLGRG